VVLERRTARFISISARRVVGQALVAVPLDAHVDTVSDHARNGLVIHPPKVKAAAIMRTKLQSRFAPEIIAYQISVTVSRLHNALSADRFSATTRHDN
jgi:hypothetical protein